MIRTRIMGDVYAYGGSAPGGFVFFQDVTAETFGGPARIYINEECEFVSIGGTYVGDLDVDPDCSYYGDGDSWMGDLTFRDESGPGVGPECELNGGGYTGTLTDVDGRFTYTGFAGGGGGGTLAATLSAGNTSGGTDIQMSNGDIITAVDGVCLTLTGGLGTTGAPKGNDGGCLKAMGGSGGYGAYVGGNGGDVELWPGPGGGGSVDSGDDGKVKCMGPLYLEEHSDLTPDTEAGMGILYVYDSDGQLRYRDTSNTVHQLTPAGGASVFESVSNVIRPVTGSEDDDFVVGSQSLDDSGTSGDARMLFDKSKGAFRAGTVNSGEWNDTERGNYSFAGGLNSIADGLAATAFGYRAQAALRGQFAISAGSPGSWAAQAQSSIFTMFRQTTDATETELSFLQNTLNRATFVRPGSWMFRISVVARQTTGSGGVQFQSAAYDFVGLVKLVNTGVISFVGTPTKTVVAEEDSSWDCNVDVHNDTGYFNDALIVKVTGAVNQTIQWVARFDLVEVNSG
jgi:hypothetical protein